MISHHCVIFISYQFQLSVSVLSVLVLSVISIISYQFLILFLTTVLFLFFISFNFSSYFLSVSYFYEFFAGDVAARVFADLLNDTVDTALRKLATVELR